MTLEQFMEQKVRDIITSAQGDEYLSLKQVADIFGCSRTWVYRQHANGHLQIYKFGGKTRIKRSEMLKLGVPQ